MTEPTPRIVKCPTCGATVKWTSGNAYRPFCSERCRLIDFGGWADEQNRITGSISEEDVLSSQLDDPS